LESIIVSVLYIDNSCVSLFTKEKITLPFDKTSQSSAALITELSETSKS